jgi:hypothetical protein
MKPSERFLSRRAEQRAKSAATGAMQFSRIISLDIEGIYPIGVEFVAKQLENEEMGARLRELEAESCFSLPLANFMSFSASQSFLWANFASSRRA